MCKKSILFHELWYLQGSTKEMHFQYLHGRSGIHLIVPWNDNEQTEMNLTRFL